MTIYKSSPSFVGDAVGVLLLSTTYPKAPGNVAHAGSYSFPVRFKVMDIPSPWWCDAEGPSDKRFQIFLEAAKELEAEGVKAITTGCGFFAVYQKRAAAELKIPLFSSPLLMVPMVSRMIGGRKVGILTAGGKHLSSGPYLANVGIDPSIPVVVRGMEDSPEFWNVIVQETKPELDMKVFTEEVVSVANRMVAENPDVGAIVLECSDLPPTARAVAEATGRPVFDFITLAHLVARACAPVRYS